MKGAVCLWSLAIFWFFGYTKGFRFHPTAFAYRQPQSRLLTLLRNINANYVLDSDKTFEDYHEYLPEWLLRSCERLGYHHPTVTQAAAFPVIFLSVNGDNLHTITLF
jgi:hypothetical protein